MNSLQKMFEEWIQDLPYQLLAQIVARKAEKRGVTLSEREVSRVMQQLKDGKTETVRVRQWEWWKRKTVDLQVTDDDWAPIEAKLSESLDDKMDATINTAVRTASRLVFRSLRRTWPRERRLQRRDRRGFKRRLRSRWVDGLDKLRMFLSIAREYGSSVNQTLRADDSCQDPCLREALTRLHARACQVTDEIICLMEDGFADGAMARWRTLHEISVVALFLSEKGESAARSYLDHQAVESFKAATDYRRCSTALGYESLPEREFGEIKRKRDEVILRYGDEFKGQYGWAAAFMEEGYPRFSDIERATGIDHLRSHYRMASHGVHANPKGIFFKLGLTGNEDMLLAGPSNAGLADPGHFASISLLQVNSVLGVLRPNLDSLVVMSILSTLSEEIGEALLAAHRGLEGCD